ncbi:MAG: L,D-transpeptidase family protein [Rhodospirillaceae bacterium]
MTASPPEPHLIVSADGRALWRGRRYRCAIGSGAIRADKREGDGATPAGRYRLIRVLYRADRGPAPATILPVAALDPADGWCDEPADPDYNRPVRLPHRARGETLWRDDRLYDLLAVTDHNAEPAVPGAGSAIFVHVARPDYGPTRGCVAFAPDDLRKILAEWTEEDRLVVPGE